jgi:hypothetical protein
VRAAWEIDDGESDRFDRARFAIRDRWIDREEKVGGRFDDGWLASGDDRRRGPRLPPPRVDVAHLTLRYCAIFPAPPLVTCAKSRSSMCDSALASSPAAAADRCAGVTGPSSSSSSSDSSAPMSE